MTTPELTSETDAETVNETDALPETVIPEITFDDLGLHPDVLRAVHEKGYIRPTAIQCQAIPPALAGRDLIGSAPTGTGKTAAFALPTLTRLAYESVTSSLVLSPTRELAMQAEENFREYGKIMEARLALLYGGVGYGTQIASLEDDPEVIIATPGRLLDHISERRIDMSRIGVVILDEVDRMLDMGFIDDVRKIVQLCPKQRQTLLFSATIPDAIRRLANWALVDPVVIDAGQRRTPAETIDHAVYPVDGIQKYDLLLALLQHCNYSSVIVFTRTKRDADRVSEWLLAHDLTCTTLHADRSQRERQDALQGFKDGKFGIMVATDVASRGLDVSNISHVINYNVPENPEDYVHRIGRTGRANREGEAFTLYSNDEYSFLSAIERYIEKPLERRKLEGFAYRTEPDLGKSAPITTGPTGVSKNTPRGRRGRRA